LFEPRHGGAGAFKLTLDGPRPCEAPEIGLELLDGRSEAVHLRVCPTRLGLRLALLIDELLERLVDRVQSAFRFIASTNYEVYIAAGHGLSLLKASDLFVELLVRLLAQYTRDRPLEKSRIGDVSIIDPTDNNGDLIHEVAEGVVPSFRVAVVQEKTHIGPQRPDESLY
jgi:hypothetical protein